MVKVSLPINILSQVFILILLVVFKTPLSLFLLPLTLLLTLLLILTHSLLLCTGVRLYNKYLLEGWAGSGCDLTTGLAERLWAHGLHIQLVPCLLTFWLTCLFGVFQCNLHNSRHSSLLGCMALVLAFIFGLFLLQQKDFLFSIL